MRSIILYKLFAINIIFLIFIPTLSCAITCPKTELNKQDNAGDISKAMDEAKMVSLSAGIIINNSLVWYEGHGYYREHYNPLVPAYLKTPSKDTIYMAASISKSITATAIFQLYEKELINIDDSISKYFGFEFKNPFYPNINITIKMILNHTSGLKDPGFYVIFPVFNTVPGLFIKLLSINKFDYFYNKFWHDEYSPGTCFNYSNTGYGILQYLIEKVSGSSFEEYCKENIFEPLEMYNTSFHHKDFKSKNQAVPYLWINDSSYYQRLFHYDVPILAAGSLRTNIEDLSHFLIAHMNNGVYKNFTLLNDSTIKLMHNKTVVFDDKNYIQLYSGYCLGWMIREDVNYSGHGGDTHGSHSMMIMNESGGTGLIYFWNSSDTSDYPLELKIEKRKNVENILLKKINEMI